MAFIEHAYSLEYYPGFRSPSTTSATTLPPFSVLSALPTHTSMRKKQLPSYPATKPRRRQKYVTNRIRTCEAEAIR